MIWVRTCLEQKYELSGQILGDGPEEAKEVTYLGRKIKWNSWGLEYEADIKHAQDIVKLMGISKGRAVVTPGQADDDYGETDVSVLDAEETIKFRRIAAKANYLSQDRMDIGFVSKCIAQKMAHPCKKDWGLIKRLARYLLGANRATLKFEWQDPCRYITCFTDADWGGLQTNEIKH